MTSAQTVLLALEHSALSTGLRASAWVYPLINTLHIVGIALLVGPIVILDLRLLRRRAGPTVSVLAATLLPSARIGFGLALLSGLLLFSARPLDYAFHALFQFKLACIALALLNIVLLHRSAAWAAALGQDRTDARVRLGCGVSLLCWLATLGLGRLIGYR